MMDHVEKVLLRHEHKEGTFVCRHPQCEHLGDFLISLDAFNDHVHRVHGVKLGLANRRRVFSVTFFCVIE